MEFGDSESGKKGVRELVEASESGESSEDVGDSPRSVVGKWRRSKIGVVHSQVLKIREEDSHLGEDIIMIAKESFINAGPGQNAQIRIPPSAVDVMLSSRLILLSSPLSGKTTVRASSLYRSINFDG